MEMPNKTEEDYLQKLVSYRSISTDTNATKKCAQYCSDFFQNAGLHSKVIEYNGYPNVVATTQNTKKPKIFLQAHMDVVPGKNELFVLKKSKTKLMGRGTFDMKFGCASFMKVVSTIGEQNKKYDYGIMLSFDEEIGGHNGVQAMLDDGYSCDVCILPDSGQNWKVDCR